MLFQKKYVSLHLIIYRKTICMKEFVISEVKAETAILVGLITKEQDEEKTKEYLDELEFLPIQQEPLPLNALHKKLLL